MQEWQSKIFLNHIAQNLIQVQKFNHASTCLGWEKIIKHFVNLYVFTRPYYPQGVDLAYLQTGISRVFLGGFEFRESVFFGGTGHSSCIFWVVK